MKKVYMKKRYAFTLIELVFVIIILGIVSSIGTEIIANIYKNYLLQRATHRASLKTELAAQQIANLLSYRIPATTVARNPNNFSDNVLVTDPTLTSDTTHILLEWIGTDNDGFSASIPPAWSGFCDVNASDDQQYIITRGSNLSLADTIFKNLSNNEVGLNALSQYPAIFFNHPNYTKNSSTSTIVPYMVVGDGTYNACMGVVSANKSCISTVSYTPTSPSRLTFVHPTGSPNKIIVEHYKLAWTAYSIWQIDDNGDGLYDLKLCYNYQPWEDERLSSNGCPGTLSTIMTNVSVFKFAESGNTFRFKICAQENIGEDYNISICKEKAIIL
jgi:prepilin-type N-terminal cleavage/methylation domain-containing protein